MADLSDFTDLAAKGAAKGQDLVSRAVDRALDLVPTRGEVVDTVTATANELIELSQDVQQKVLNALKWNV